MSARRSAGSSKPEASVRSERDGVARRAATAWKRVNAERAERELEPLEPVGLHEARHTYASTMLAAGVGARVVAELMGHAHAGLVWNRNGHVLQVVAVAAFDAYQASGAVNSRP